MRAPIVLTALAALAPLLAPLRVAADGAPRGSISWRLLNKDLLGRPGNNFALTCGRAR